MTPSIQNKCGDTIEVGKKYYLANFTDQSDPNYCRTRKTGNKPVIVQVDKIECNTPEAPGRCLVTYKKVVGGVSGRESPEVFIPMNKPYVAVLGEIEKYVKQILGV